MVLRHNQLRDIFVDFCHKANRSVKVEAGSTLTLDLSRSCPADALVSNSEAKDFSTDEWEVEHSPSEVQCQSPPQYSM